VWVKFISLYGCVMAFSGVLAFLLPAAADGNRTLPMAEPSSRAVWFDIPPQPLAQALARFGEQAGLAALVDSRLTAGRRSGGVHGYYPPPAALRLLLQNTGLAAHYTSADAFTVLMAEARKNSLPLSINNAGDTSTLGLGGNGYAAVIQRAILRLLCASPQTRPGGYRAVLQFWLSAQGSVSRVELLDSTGLDSRDTAILDRLRRLHMDMPQQGHLPQPLTVLLLPGINGDCQLSGITRR
jgi:hypothetical protein